MLPDQMPSDLYNKQSNHQTTYLQKPLQKIDEQQVQRKDTVNSLKPLKPMTVGKANHLPSKVFNQHSANSHYNSQKNLRNNQTSTTNTQFNMGNNRYSSQINRNSEYEDEEEQINDEGELQMEVADENCAEQIDNNYSQTQRRGSQRYKDRVHTMRLQSQETYQREHMATGGQNYYTEMQGDRKQYPYNQENTQNEDDEFEIFERAQEQHHAILSQRSNYNNEHHPYSHTEMTADANYGQGVDPAAFYQHQNMNRNYQAKRWTTQPHQNQENTHEDMDGDKTPQEDLSSQFFDPACGAHFQYRELLKRLSDITTSSHGKNSSNKRKTNKRKSETEGRVPLKEKTQEIVNQPQQHSNIVKKKNMSILEPKLRPFSNSAKNSKKTEKVAPPTQVNHLMHTNQVAHQKLTKLLLTNQENNFIDKKLKDLQNELHGSTSNHKNNISKNISIHQNKSHHNLHKTSEKTLSKLSGLQQQNCQINNMKLKSSNNAHSGSQSSSKQTHIINNQAKVPLSHQKSSTGLQPNLQTVSSISNIFTNTIVSSSISSGNTNNVAQNQPSMHTSSTSALLNATKCPSSNFLRTATTAFTTSTTTKSSAVLTQSNSNKQIVNRETPEASTRQKVRLTGTALSSTNKRNHHNGGMTTLSNNSHGTGTQQSSCKALQQIVYQQPDSERKSQQSSGEKKQHSSRNHMSNTSHTNNHPSSAPRSNSSHKKVQMQKMMTKNPSFHKNMVPDNQASKKQMNDFYNAIFKKISNTNFTALATNAQQQMKVSQARISEKQQSLGQSSKTTRVSGKVSRLSKGGNGSNSVNSNSKSKQRSNEKAQQQHSPRSDSHSKSKTRKNSNNVQRESIYSGDQTQKASQKAQINIMNTATSSIQIQKVNQLLKKFQDSTSNQSQVIPQKQVVQSNQPSILMNHQMKKYPCATSSRPLSGNNNNMQQNINHFLAEHQSFNRKNSIDKVQQQALLTQTAIQDYQSQQQNLVEQSQTNMTCMGMDNRQSLQVQHRTMEKKSSQQAQGGQINLKHSDKMSRYLQQKKEELVMATQKNQNVTKKGFLLANIKIQKNSRLQQMTQETYERLHLPTEEDDLKGNDVETFQIGNLITNVKDEMYSVYNDQQPHVNYQPQSLQGGRISVKVKAKNF